MSKIYYFRESLTQSVLSDMFSVGLIIALVVLNKMYLGDKWYFDIFAMLLFFVTVSAKGRVKVFTNLQEFKEHVNSIKD